MRSGGGKFCNLQITVIDEALVVLRHAAAYSVVGHRDCVRTMRPQDWAILAIIGHLPNTGCCLDERQVAVGITDRREIINRRVLVQLVRRVDAAHPTFPLRLRLPMSSKS